jgi:hypothetical protein
LTSARRAGIVSRVNSWRIPCLLLCLSVSALKADEGYWLFTDPPTQAIANEYHFSPDAPWLDHLRGACVRIAGASGSFVSADGLVITNRHVGEGQLHTLSTRQHNYEEDGFYAPTFGDELHCQGLEMMVLQSTENVTNRVQTAVKPGATPAEAEAKQRAIEAAIEKESFDRTGLTSEVVTLFGGARYDLYRYKKYPDVRLVFAPDRQMAMFGGDPDNFEYPRYDLDICLFRVYEHDRPLASSDYLKWNSAGPANNEFVFVAGHPGSSQRLVTMDELAYQRDMRLPLALRDLEQMEAKLNAFAAISPERAREAAEALESAANSRKAFRGFLSGLRAPDLFAAKAAEEKSFHDLLAQSSGQKAAFDSFAHIREAVDTDRNNYNAYQAYERFAYRSDLFNLARTLVRAAAERAKPNRERLPAYRDSSLPTLEFRLFSGRPYYPDLEQLFLQDALEQLVAQFGSEPLVKTLLAGKSPRERAAELVRGTQLEGIAYRRKLYAGGEAAIAASHDPLIEFAAAIDPPARAARKIDDTDDEMKRRAYAMIYQARVELGRAPRYPDATGTLRLAYGAVKSWSNGNTSYPSMTDFAGLFRHSTDHADAPPYRVAPAWMEAKPQLNLAMPLNFITTADGLGGNSGSPVVNAKGEFVGVIFDGNEPSLAGRYLYDANQNRSIAVDSAGIIEALRKIYHAGPLADELESGRPKK